MPNRVADRVGQLRRALFVGRAPEVAVFEEALEKAIAPFGLLAVTGPGGVGKSTLLREFAAMAAREDRKVVRLDARDLEPLPTAFLSAVGAALELENEDEIWARLNEPTPRLVLLIDTYELLTPLDSWLREKFLPSLCENAIVVVAGRDELPPGWRLDAAWSSLLRRMPLRNLAPLESTSYLERRGVPAGQHPVLLEFTHGHPLALSLVADLYARHPEFQFQPPEAPDVLKVLLDHLIQQVPSPRHRHALEACSLVSATTEEILAAMLGVADVHEVFEWLRELSFIEGTRDGLVPHDYIRELISVDLRWRNATRYRELHGRARAYYTAALAEHSASRQQQLVADLIFLHRNNPVVRPFFIWQEKAGLHPSSVSADDFGAIEAMVTGHEGAESARLALQWLRSQPENATVLRAADGGVEGWLLNIALHSAAPAQIEADPATAAVWRYLARNAPLREQEGAYFFRFWMARDTYQAVSPVQSLIFANIVRHYLTTPALAFSFLYAGEPEFWAPAFEYTEANRLPAADFELDGKLFGVFGHDWRKRPLGAWLELLGERETSEEAHMAPAPPEPTLLVLSEPVFQEAVRAALRAAGDAGVLRNNPLLQSRVVIARCGTDSTSARRIAALNSLLREAAESAHNSPKTERQFRAVELTYLRPAPTQERAAELLDLPFSTYRRHLKAGVDAICTCLWRLELES